MANGGDQRLDWYAVALADRVHVKGANDAEDRYEISLVLVQSDAAEKAPGKAMALARERDEEYRNADGQLVTWTCVEALNVSWMNDGVEEGSEVYSFFVNQALLEEIRKGIKERFRPNV